MGEATRADKFAGLPEETLAEHRKFAYPWCWQWVFFLWTGRHWVGFVTNKSNGRSAPLVSQGRFVRILTLAYVNV
jgi:hypothetical protein